MLPVPGIDGPHNRRHPHASKNRQGGGIIISSRRTHQRRRYAAGRLNLLAGGSHLIHDFLGADFADITMVMGMIGHLAALGYHPLNHRSVRVDSGAQHKEGGPPPISLKAVQNPVGNRCLWPIVKGQSDHRPGGIRLKAWIFLRRTRSFGHNPGPDSVYSQSYAFLPCRGSVCRPVRPLPVLEHPVVQIIMFCRASGQLHADGLQRQIASRAPAFRSVGRPFQPAGAA